MFFSPEVRYCPCCGSKLVILNIQPRDIFTLHIGYFKAGKCLMKCSHCENEKIYSSNELHRLVPPDSNYGYDVINLIGQLTYSENKQAREIKIILKTEYNIPISISGIEYLSKKYIIYLLAVHENNISKIVERINSNGGYILHTDALGSKAGKKIISALDSISNLVLGNAKILSENSDYIIPFLNKIKESFGTPLAIVYDMGRGGMKAAESVFPRVKKLVCHFHFLRDIGKDLLGENYDIIRKQLRIFGGVTELKNISKKLRKIIENSDGENVYDDFYEAKINNKPIEMESDIEAAIKLYIFIEWMLSWKSESNGYGFPFDRPHLDLALRIREVVKILEEMKLLCHFSTKEFEAIQKIYERLKKLLQKLPEDKILEKTIEKTIEKITEEIKIFDRLRDVMRITDKDGNQGLNDKGSADIKTIEKEMKKFIKELKKDKNFKKSQKGKKFFKQINKYWDKLFADPILIETETGTQKIIPQRTNNIMEQMFRELTRANKRKTGDASIARTIKGIVADTPLIRNLKDEKYMEMILGEKDKIEEVFAEINVEIIREKLKEHQIYNEKMPAKIKTLLQKENEFDILSIIKQ